MLSFASLFRGLKGISNGGGAKRIAGRRQNARRPFSHRPLVEALEDRALPSAGLGWALAPPGTNTSWAVAADSAGNTYSGGSFQGTATFGSTVLTSGSAFVAKADAAGNYLWAVGFDSGAILSNRIALDNGGNVYVSLFAGGASLTKLNGSDGSTLWSNALGNSFVGGIAVDGAGSSYVTYRPNGGGTQTTVSKFDSGGSSQWSVQFGNPSGSTSFFSGSAGIAVDAANVYLTGTFFGKNVDFNPGAGINKLSSVGSGSAYVLKLTNSGSFVWVGGLLPTSGNGWCEGAGIAVDGSGNTHIVGSFTGSVDFNPGSVKNSLNASNGSAYVAKLNSSGGYVWARGFGGGGAFGNSIALDSSGNVYVAGQFEGAGDFNPGGGTFNMTSAGQYDAFVLKLTSGGNFDWAVSAGTTGDDRGNGIAVDGSGNVYVAGWFVGTVDFDPGAGVFNLTSATQSAFLWKLNQV